MHYSVCGNYVDIHVNFHPEQVPVPAGTTFDVRYICELYGDGETEIDELKQIGLRATQTGDIVIGRKSKTALYVVQKVHLRFFTNPNQRASNLEGHTSTNAERAQIFFSQTRPGEGL